MTPTRRSRVILLDHSAGPQEIHVPTPPPRPRRPRRRLRVRLTRRSLTAIALLLLAPFGLLIGWRIKTADTRSTPGIMGQVMLGRNASLGGAQLFPASNAWNTPIVDRPVDPRSDEYLAALGLTIPLHPDFGTNRLRTHLFGIPYVVIDGGDTPRYTVPFNYGDQSDPGPYPIPDDVPIEDGGDRHALVLDRNDWRLYELYLLEGKPPLWEAGSGAVFDLGLDASRPRGWTSADAGGLPVLAGLARADEVYDVGEIRHALRFTARQTQQSFIYPARHQASRLKHPSLPPMGLRLRLKASVRIDELPEGARVIAVALQRYGMILADNGGPLFLTGTADRRWRRKDTEALKRLKTSDFEVIVPPPPPPSDTPAWREKQEGKSGFSEQ